MIDGICYLLQEYHVPGLANVYSLSSLANSGCLDQSSIVLKIFGVIMLLLLVIKSKAMWFIRIKI